MQTSGIFHSHKEYRSLNWFRSHLLKHERKMLHRFQAFLDNTHTHEHEWNLVQLSENAGQPLTLHFAYKQFVCSTTSVFRVVHDCTEHNDAMLKQSIYFSSFSHRFPGWCWFIFSLQSYKMSVALVGTFPFEHKKNHHKLMYKHTLYQQNVHSTSKFKQNGHFEKLPASDSKIYRHRAQQRNR